MPKHWSKANSPSWHGISQRIPSVRGMSWSSPRPLAMVPKETPRSLMLSAPCLTERYSMTLRTCARPRPRTLLIQLRECVRAVERLWQPWPKLVGSLVQGDEVDLVVWINVDVADDKIEAVKRVVAATSAKRRDAILGTIQETARRLTRDKRHLMALLEDEFLTWNPGELEHRLKTFFYSHLYTASATGAKNQEAAIPGYETKPILSLRVERESRRFLNFYRSAVREGYLHDEDFLDSIRDAVRAAEERVWETIH